MQQPIVFQNFPTDHIHITCDEELVKSHATGAFFNKDYLSPKSPEDFEDIVQDVVNLFRAETDAVNARKADSYNIRLGKRIGRDEYFFYAYEIKPSGKMALLIDFFRRIFYGNYLNKETSRLCQNLLNATYNKIISPQVISPQEVEKKEFQKKLEDLNNIFIKLLLENKRLTEITRRIRNILSTGFVAQFAEQS